MKSSDILTLDALAARWNAVPHADAIAGTAHRLLATPQTEEKQLSRSEFNQLLANTVTVFQEAMGKPVSCELTALGQAIAWLSTLGGTEELYLAFIDGETAANRDIIVALRDACLGQLQSDYRAYLLNRYCADWEARTALANQWLKNQIIEVLSKRLAWEFADCTGELLESVGAGERLAAHLRTRHNI